MSKEWKIKTINAGEVNKFRTQKQKDLGNAEATVEIDEVVEAALNNMATDGWDVYECKITSNQFARIIFYREKTNPQRD